MNNKILLLITIIWLNLHLYAFSYAKDINFYAPFAMQWLQQNSQFYQTGTTQGWAGFDKVYFVTLPQRLDNVRQVIKQLGLTTQANIFKAIIGKNLDFAELKVLRIIDKVRLQQLSPQNYGQVGFSLSHMAVLYDCYRDPTAQTCVIFEDDLTIPDQAVTKRVATFYQEFQNLKQPWDMLFLDYCLDPGTGVVHGDVRSLVSPACTHAYVIKKDVFQKTFAKVFPWRESLDLSFRRLIKRKEIIAYGPNKAVFFSQNRDKFATTLADQFDAKYPKEIQRFFSYISDEDNNQLN